MELLAHDFDASVVADATGGDMLHLGEVGQLGLPVNVHESSSIAVALYFFHGWEKGNTFPRISNHGQCQII
jgi:hypothetical protein